MKSKEGFDLDSSGNIITNPLAGWTLANAADGMLLILAIQYLQNPQQLQTGDCEQIQFLLTYQQCQEFAAALTRAGEKMAEIQSHQRGPTH